LDREDLKKFVRMIREIVHIDETLCDGCGLCIPSCHEGALRIVDGKARLISDLMCDGLGACLGHCPQGAITIEKREAGAYDETRVMEIMAEKGENTVVAHLQHLKEHQEMAYLREGITFLNERGKQLGLDTQRILSRVHGAHVEKEQLACGCAGSEARSFTARSAAGGYAPGLATSQPAPAGPVPGDPSLPGPSRRKYAQAGLETREAHAARSSELGHWPVQMHLINPVASCYRGADVLLAADCVAYALGDFHSRWLRGRSLAIACPKLDSGTDSYVIKLKSLIDEAKINTLTVLIMQVPCCGGLMRMVREAAAGCSRKVPVRQVIVGVEGEILQEEWV